MERRKFTWEFKFEAVRLIKERGVSYAQASLDLGVLSVPLLNFQVRVSTCQAGVAQSGRTHSKLCGELGTKFLRRSARYSGK
jgi:transposase-like protein